MGRVSFPLFLFSIFFLILTILYLNFVYAQSAVVCPNGCTVSPDGCVAVGEEVEGRYCDFDKSFKDLKSEGNSCLNNYECFSKECVDDKCQAGYDTTQKKSFIDSIILFLTGKECTQNSHCDSGEVCNVDNQCVTSGGSTGGGGGGGCRPVWSCTEWSFPSDNCGTRTCTDTRNCGKDAGKPVEIASCATLPVIQQGYCGDGVCNDDEDVESCDYDCLSSEGVIPPEQKKLSIWVFLIPLIFILIAVIIALIIYFLKRNRSSTSFEVKQNTNPSSGSTNSSFK